MKTLLASDYDGTLAKLGYISIRTKKAVMDYRDDSHFFAASTGRCPQMFSRRSMKMYYYIVGSTGARICDGNKNIIYEQPLDPQDSEFVYNLAISVGAKHIIAHLEDTYAFVKPHWVNFFLNIHSHFTDPGSVRKRVTGKEKMYQLSINLSSEQQVQEVVEKCRDRNVSAFINGKAVDVVHKNCSKSRGIEILREIIKPERIFTIGDEKNDYEMLRDYESFMMKNGNQVLEEVADYKVKNLREAIGIILENERKAK
ncbi:MAG: HAD-IIB family hydrolase [Erysipelotrichaceae bacterium]|nr:HAD-IIB family hydrolase [Erysipelotrichaceae bacterium]